MDNLFCCLKPPDRGSRGKSIRSAASTGTSTSYIYSEKELPDLLQDEGEDYQKDQWQQVIAEKRNALLQTKSRVLPKFSDVDGVMAMVDEAGGLSPNMFLQTLKQQYTIHGHSGRISRIHNLFTSIQPFIVAVNTIVQNDTAASIVWGCLSLVFQSVLNYAAFWDDLQGLFEDVARDLPRFHGYVQVLQTPRLHSALRAVYATFIDLCMMTLDCLCSNRCFMAMRVQWSSFALEFKASSGQLVKLSTNFEKEAQLAHYQEEQRRHDQVIGTLLQTSTGQPTPKPTAHTLRSNVSIPRNDRFIGRTDTLALIHSVLKPNSGKSQPFKSCLIHSIGGMGKTETALEYTYRYSHSYGYILWLRAQTPDLLRESFITAVKSLGIVTNTQVSAGQARHLALEWFRTTDDPWLVVYDNAEDLTTLQEYWPAGPQGAVIVTSQNPGLGHLTSQSIQLQPMTASEGCTLIQNYLRRGASEQQHAEQLSDTLGGLPLAIVHFTGYITRSQCLIEHISASLNKRLHSSRVWRMQQDIPSVARAYQHTLDTVWEMAIQRLSEDARVLLEYIAFLDPDDIPVDMFIGRNNEDASNESTSSSWQYWDVYRFNDAIGILSERNLVNRTVLGNGIDSLRTHRALQISILQQLDEDLPRRAARFQDVVGMVRKAIPTANVVHRSDEKQFPQFEKYIPQASSVLRVFENSEPAIDGTLEFASILNDCCFYSFVKDNGAAVQSYAATGQKVCVQFPEDNTAAQVILADLLQTLSQILHYLSDAGRREALELAQRVLAMRKKALAGIPEDKWTKLQTINFARAHADLGWELCEADRPSEAEGLYQTCVDIYQRANAEIRLILIQTNQLMVLSTAQKVADTREQARSVVRAIESIADDDNPIVSVVRFQASLALFTVGDVEEALRLGLLVFQQRSAALGKSNNLALASQYCVAVYLQNSGDLEQAGKLLKEVLDASGQTDYWREEDIIRVKFRLSIVLRLGHHLAESETLMSQVAEYIKIQREKVSKAEFTDADDMAILDKGVTRCHGRTSGIWSNGEVW
ncbi:pfs domain-containing protein [Stachybotrys elegans]|uniref:Pfs domain-containing protein n=1 Tax=Stachybotrys elegans TaxID=80388 RepID=A0A8K0T0P4_9HYPO|nr:pfs domain-containing protein [Stachybotrys elegans]